MEKICGMLRVVYAKEEFLAVYLLLNLQNLDLASKEDTFGEQTQCEDAALLPPVLDPDGCSPHSCVQPALS